eukprot:scaffold8649_cov185-Amphora_coffeaeformis.AAC.2
MTIRARSETLLSNYGVLSLCFPKGIMGITSLLLEDAEALPKDAQESLSLVMASSGLLLTLVNNMLDVRKCDANKMNDFNLVPVPLRAPMEDAVAFCRPLAAISNVLLELDYKDNTKHALIKSDTLRLQQVLINLISNAIKYTATGSAITVSTEPRKMSEVKAMIESSLAVGLPETDDNVPGDDARVTVFSVADKGKGIGKGEEKKIFRKFSQLEGEQTHKLGRNAVGQPLGSGLGLNLCVSFIRRMQGNIWVTNNATGGCCFSFYLPFASDSASDEAPLPPSPSEKLKAVLAPSTSHASKYKVLVVDDTLINRKVFTRMLSRIGVGLVTSVESGLDGLKALEKGSYNFVITDIQMPEMDGFQFTQKLHENPTIAAKLPVVVGLTAETSRDLDERCHKSGMADVLHKPITLAEMCDYFENVVGTLRPTTALV